jgi:ABC-type bacteriocin/lantibiotic exporter with double-glycine peptidase domain
LKKILNRFAPTLILTLQVVRRSLLILDRTDRQKSFLIILIYLLLGLMDMAAVFLLGLVGSLSVSGVSTGQPGERVRAVLEFAGISQYTLQQQVAILGGLSAFALVFKSVFSLYLSKKTLLFLSRRAALISRTLVFRLLGQELISIREKTIQETIFSLTYGVQSVAIGILGSALLLISDIFLIVIFSVSLFLVDTLVAVMSLILFSSVGMVLYRLLHRRANFLGETATKLNIESGDKISEVVACYRELLVKDRRNFYAHEIGAIRFKIADVSARLGFMNLLSKYVMEITLVVGGLTIGVAQFVTQPATRAVAVLAIFLVASGRIAPAVLRVQTGLISMRINMGSARPTLDLVEEHLVGGKFDIDNLKPYRGRSDFTHDGFQPYLKLSSVSYTYPTKRKESLRNINLEITSGEFVGIVGPSGSGKTTLADVLLGVIKPDEGTVILSGFPPGESFKKWPGAVAYVPQEVKVINGSIKENVCLGFSPEDVSDEEVSSLLESVQLQEFSTTAGLQIPAGEGGSKMSGGQRQRLGLARSLFTSPKLLILDEATSALDSVTEKKITDYINSVKGSLTLVVIAHRLSTLKNADRVIYIKNGEILAQGTFDELRELLPEFDQQAKEMGIR